MCVFVVVCQCVSLLYDYANCYTMQMMNDSNYLVQYEAAKALITLGNLIICTHTDHLA